MPLIQGKSEKSFGKNVGTEIDAGKPKKQALAISYAIQRKMAKKKMHEGGKMAYGGSVVSPSTDSDAQQMSMEDTRKNQIANAFGSKKAKGGMIENEDLNPTYEPEHGAEMEMMKEHHYPSFSQQHDDLEEPHEADYHEMPDEKDTPHGMVGNIAQAIMRRKMAHGGMLHKDRMAMGGMMRSSKMDEEMMHPHEKIMTPHERMNKKMRMAEGGEVEEYPNRDHVYAHDKGEMGMRDIQIHNFGKDNLTNIADHPDDDYLSDEEDTSYFHPNEMDDDESSPRRTMILERIMRGIAKRHYG
jgi:hypothetical protein